MATVALPIPATEKNVEEKVDYLNLSCSISYEELHPEAVMALKPELFEGMRFDFTKMLNQKFALSHSVFMGPTEIPSRSSETIKIPTAHYEFGANFLDHPKLLLVGRILTDGRLNARVKWDLTENLTLKANAQLTNEPHMSHGMISFDYKCRLRGRIDSNGCIATYLEELLNVGLNFILSAELDRRKKGLQIWVWFDRWRID